MASGAKNTGCTQQNVHLDRLNKIYMPPQHKKFYFHNIQNSTRNDTSQFHKQFLLSEKMFSILVHGRGVKNRIYRVTLYHTILTTLKEVF